MLGNCFRPLCALLLVILVLHEVHIGSALFFRPSPNTDFRASVSSGTSPPSQPIHTVYPKTFSTFHIVNPPVEISSYKPLAINYNAQALNRQVSNLLNSNNQISPQNQNQPQQKFEPPLTFFQTSSLVRTIPIIPERSRNNTLSRNLKNINNQFPSSSSVGGVKRKTQNRSNGPTKAVSNTANTRPKNSNRPKPTKSSNSTKRPKSTKNPKKTKSVNPVQRGRSPRVKSSKANPNLASNRKILKNTNRGRTSSNIRSGIRPSKQPDDEDDEETNNDADYDSDYDADNEDSPQEDEPEEDLNEDGGNDEGDNDEDENTDLQERPEEDDPQEEDPEEDEPQEEPDYPQEDDPQNDNPQEDDSQNEDPEEDEDNFAKLRKPSLSNSDAERIQSAIQILVRTANNLQRQQSVGRLRTKSQR